VDIKREIIQIQIRDGIQQISSIQGIWQEDCCSWKELQVRMVILQI
jgi:hypothetical protein